MKLEVGMYARTKDGYIGNLNIKKETIAVAQWTGDYKLEEITQYYINDNRYNEFEIVKAHHNIIRLIGVGDYVNGYLVYEILEYKDNTRAIVIGDDNKSIIWEESSQYIKSIVTKEQFESISYKIGD